MITRAIDAMQLSIVVDDSNVSPFYHLLHYGIIHVEDKEHCATKNANQS